MSTKMCFSMIAVAVFSTIAISNPSMISAEMHPELYSKVLPILQQKTRLKIQLPPAVLVTNSFGLHTALQSQNVYFARRFAYSVNLDANSDCNGAPICSVGNMYATRTTGRIPANRFQRYPLSRKQIKALSSHSTGKIKNHQEVQLTNSIRGYVENPQPGAIFTTMSWVQHKTLYQLTLKKTPPKKMLSIARETIHYDNNN